MDIRSFSLEDTQDVISVWEKCGLLRPWNDPLLDIQRKMKVQPELFVIGTLAGEIIATAMFGYDGHRGWLNYLAVLPAHRFKGYAKNLMLYGEKALEALGCPKLNLQIRRDNEEALLFYKALGYLEDDVVSFSKRFSEDTAKM